MIFERRCWKKQSSESQNALIGHKTPTLLRSFGDRTCRKENSRCTHITTGKTFCLTFHFCQCHNNVFDRPFCFAICCAHAIMVPFVYMYSASTINNGIIYVMRKWKWAKQPKKWVWMPRAPEFKEKWKMIATQHCLTAWSSPRMWKKKETKK